MTVTNIAMMRPCFGGYPFQGTKLNLKWVKKLLFLIKKIWINIAYIALMKIYVSYKNKWWFSLQNKFPVNLCSIDRSSSHTTVFTRMFMRKENKLNSTLAMMAIQPVALFLSIQKTHPWCYCTCSYWHEQ